MRLPSLADVRSRLTRLRFTGSPVVLAVAALAATAAVATPMAGTLIADEEGNDEQSSLLDELFGPCRNLGLFDQMPDAGDGSVPVLLLPDSAGSLMWSSERGEAYSGENGHITGPGLIPALTELPDVHVQVFYPGHWTSWPLDTDRLVDALTCLHEDSGQRVTVVAHGAAGIAMWDAMAGPEAAQEAVHTTIAIGVPFGGSGYVDAHHDLLDEYGSQLPELGDPEYDGPPSMAALAHECERYDSVFAWPDQSCHRHRQVAGSPLGHALAAGEVEEELGGWPDGSEIRVIAGEIEIVDRVRAVVDGEVVDLPHDEMEVLGESLGDGFVSSEQALAVPNAVGPWTTPFVARCPEVRVHGSDLISNRCFGDQLLTNREVIDRVTRWVGRNTEQRALTALSNGTGYEIDCGDGPQEYSLWDGRYLSEDEGGAAVRLIDVELIRGEEQDRTMALVLLSCWYGVGTEHPWPGERTDVLHAYHLEAGDWVPATDPVHASFIPPSAEPQFDGDDRLVVATSTTRESIQALPEAIDRQPDPGGRSADCCPSGWSRARWRIDPDAPQIFYLEWDQALVFGAEPPPGSPDHVEDRDADWQPRRPDPPEEWDIETPADDGTDDPPTDASDRGFG